MEVIRRKMNLKVYIGCVFGVIVLGLIGLYGLIWVTQFELHIHSAADWGLSGRVSQVIGAQPIPMLGFMYVNASNGVISLSGTLRTEEDISMVIELAKQVNGVRKVVSNLEVGNYTLMYEKEIKEHLRFGYRFYKTHAIRSKKAVVHELDEYLFYRDELPSETLRRTEELRDLLVRDIEQAWREEAADWYQRYAPH